MTRPARPGAPPRQRRLAPVLLALLMLASLAPTQPAVGQAEAADEVLKPGVSYEWWNEAWHMRIPVLVHPRIPDPMVPGKDNTIMGAVNYPVRVEVDFTGAIRSAGTSPELAWPTDVAGRLNSFTFDTNSVRVVAYDRETGELVRSAERSPVVPSDFVPTLLENRERRNARFDAQANAVGTVTWTVDGVLSKPRLYFIYFDILENGAKAAPTYDAKDAAPLDSLYWTRSGTDVYGYAPANLGGAQPVLEVYGLWKNTAVRVHRYHLAGFEPEPLEHCDKVRSGLCVDGRFLGEHDGKPTFILQPLGEGRGRLSTKVQPNDPFFFHVESDKPVLVAIRPGGDSAPPNGLYYPALGGGLAGTEFRFRGLTGSSDRPFDTQFIAPTKEARVTMEFLGSFGSTQTTFTVPKGGVVHRQLAAGQSYRVVSSEPVIIAQAGRGYHMGAQAPTIHGAPVGRDLVGPVGYDFRAVALDGEAELLAFGYETPDLTARANVRPGAENAWFHRVSNPEAWGEAWGFHAKGGNVSVIVGDAGLTPVAGRHGRHFEIPLVATPQHRTNFDGRAPDLHAVVFPLFDGTRVKAVNAATGEEVLNETTNRHGYLQTPTVDGTNPMPLRVTASKPVLVYLVGENNGHYATYYGADVAPPETDVGTAEFYGHLVRWDKPLRTITLSPGETKRIPVTLTNLGRNPDGSGLRDDVVISLESSRSWPVTISSAFESGLPSQEPRDLTLVIEVPESAETGDTLTVNLTAASEGNPNMEAATRVDVAVRTKYEVDLVFRANGLKSMSRLVDAGGSTEYALLVRNRGTGDDAVAFTASFSSCFGYAVRLQTPGGEPLTTEEGRSAGTIAIPRGGEALVVLNVTAPDDEASPFPCEAAVQAISQEDSAARDQAVATTLVNVETEYSVSLEDDRLAVRPGETVTFPLTVVNEGDDTVVKVSTSDPSLPGWDVRVDPAEFLLRANGTVDAVGNRGDVATVRVNVTAAPDARVNEILPLRVTATASTGGSAGVQAEESVKVFAVVENNYTVGLDGLEVRTVFPGETLDYRFRVRNEANGPFRLQANATGVPTGWRYEATPTGGSPLLQVGDVADVAGRLTVPPGAPADRYNLTFSLLMETPYGDRGVRQATAQLQVARRVGVSATVDAATVLVSPGATRRVPVNVTNVGNADVEVDLSLDAPAGWDAALANATDRLLYMAPGDSRMVDVVLTAPDDIGDRPVEWSLTSRVPLEDPQTFRFEAGWIHRDLRVLDVRAATPRLVPGESALFAVTVENNGTAPANGVSLAVAADGRLVKNVTIRSMPPNVERLVQVPWTVAPFEHNVTLVIDHDNRFVETDETNNAVQLQLPDGGAVPAASPLLAALAAAVLALARGRLRGGAGTSGRGGAGGRAP